MLAMLRDLVQHKWHANASLLQAIGEHEEASQDLQLRELLHHILLANRFWLRLSRGVAYSFEGDAQVPASMDDDCPSIPRDSAGGSSLACLAPGRWAKPNRSDALSSRQKL